MTVIEQIEQEGGHLEGRRAGRDQENLRDLEALLQQPAAFLREEAVAADMELTNG